MVKPKVWVETDQRSESILEFSENSNRDGNREVS
jgi:hypothetical protein